MKRQFRIGGLLVLIAVCAVGFRVVTWFTLDQDPKRDWQRGLNSRSIVERRSAAMSGTLLFNRPEEAVPILVATLKRDKDAQVRIYVLNSLNSFGKSAAPSAELIESFLNDPDPRVRRAAAQALLSVTDGKAVMKIVPLIDDRDGEVRIAVLSSLASQGIFNVVALDRLADFLDDPDPRARRLAGDLLQGNGPAAFSVLPRMLDVLLRTEDQSERMTLFDHIKRIGQVKDIDAFEEMFRARMVRALKVGDPKKRRIAMTEFASYATNVARNPTTATANYDLIHRDGTTGVWSPARMPDRDLTKVALESIRPFLADPDPSVRALAIELVTELDDHTLVESDIKAIEAAIDDPDSRVRGVAVRSAQSLNVSRRVDANTWRRLLRDPDPSVRSSTLRTFQFSGFEKPGEFTASPECLAMLRTLAPDLSRTLNDPDPGVRAEAILTLKSRRERGSVTVEPGAIDAAIAKTVADLNKLLRSDDPSRAEGALFDLVNFRYRGLLDSERDLSLLRETLRKLPRDDKHPNIRSGILVMIGEIQNKPRAKASKIQDSKN